MEVLFRPSMVVLYTLLGTLIGSLFCTIPSLHIYNLAGIAFVIWLNVRTLVPYYALAPFFMSMVVAFSFMNTIPMTFLGAFDESAGATLLPSSAMVTQGKGKDAALMTGAGTLFGAFLLILFTPFFFLIWPYIYEILGAHLHWLLGVVMVFYVMSEWPKGAGRGTKPLYKFIDAWKNVFAGLFTFTISAIFGLIFTSESIIPIDVAFQNIMPVFVGFFAVPSIIQALISEFDVPKQYDPDEMNADWKDFGYGSGVGVTGGLMAAYLPAVTAGIGALFAGHATNHQALDKPKMKDTPEDSSLEIDYVMPEMYYRQERNFIISGGVGKIFYYVGAFLLLFVLTDLTPGGMGRGGLNFILKPAFAPEAGDFWVMGSAILLSASISFFLLYLFTKITIKKIHDFDARYLHYFALVVITFIIYGMTGIPGLIITSITTCIGMVPVFYNCRRSHCMAVLLVPIALGMAGYGDLIADIMALI
ncbi:MAG: tripartite tricarboxylate transporter permease [bacterium]